MKIDAERIQSLAALARLELSEQEAKAMRDDLDAILVYVEQLDSVDTEEVEPTAHVLELATPLREDRVRGTLSVDEALRNAPAHDDASIIVPKVIE